MIVLNLAANEHVLDLGHIGSHAEVDLKDLPLSPDEGLVLRLR